MKRCIFTILAIIVALPVIFPAPCAGRIDRFFLKAVGGYSQPFLPSLSNELEIQGDEKIQGGYSACISLGRTLMEKQWGVELYFAVSFYPTFDYENDHDVFEGKISHYDFAAVFKRCLIPDGERFIPYVGAGLGYGVTNLISGGGKIQTVHALALAQLEVPVRDNISILLETTYGAAVDKNSFDNPFLENLPGDTVLDSKGIPLEDRFSSFNVRIGVMIWLRPPPEEE